MGDYDRRAVVLLGQRLGEEGTRSAMARRGLSGGEEPAVAAPNRPRVVDRGFAQLGVGDRLMAQAVIGPERRPEDADGRRSDPHHRGGGVQHDDDPAFPFQEIGGFPPHQVHALVDRQVGPVVLVVAGDQHDRPHFRKQPRGDLNGIRRARQVARDQDDVGVRRQLVAVRDRIFRTLRAAQGDRRRVPMPQSCCSR